MVIPRGWLILFLRDGVSEGSLLGTARFRAAPWLVSGHQVPGEGMGQLAHVPLLCSRGTVQRPSCNVPSLSLFLAISYTASLVLHQSGKIHIGPPTLEPISPMSREGRIE